MSHDPSVLFYGITVSLVAAFGIAFAFKMAYLEHHDRLGRRTGSVVELKSAGGKGA